MHRTAKLFSTSNRRFRGVHAATCVLVLAGCSLDPIQEEPGPAAGAPSAGTGPTPSAGAAPVAGSLSEGGAPGVAGAPPVAGQVQSVAGMTSTGGSGEGTAGMTSAGGTSAGAPATGAGAPSTGGSAAGAMAMGPAVPPPACVTMAIAAKCSMACHTPATVAASGNLDLTGDFAARLIDKAATYGGITNMAECTPGAKLIDITMSANSVFLKKINGTQGTCGLPMPVGVPLTAAEKTCLQSWVAGMP